MAKTEKDVRFSKFGTVSFTGVTQVNDFIDYLEQGKLMGTKCKACGEKFFPPRAQCFKSLSNDMEWFEVTGKGKLVSFSTLRYGPTGFTDELPYTIALVDYGDYKVFGRIDPAVPNPDDALKVGMEMVAKPSKTANGQLTYVFLNA
jgi:uncharacterized protein